MEFSVLTSGLVALAVAISFSGGDASRVWWVRRRGAAKLWVPQPWPLESRNVVNFSEQLVWDWLRNTFYDDLRLVKVPVLRFTMPTQRERYRGAKWLEMLGDVYPTFTVCAAEGAAVGCVDVPGKHGMYPTRHDLKEALLSDCDTACTVPRSTRLPSPESMRMASLGMVIDNLTTQPMPIMKNSDEFAAEIKAFHRIKKLRDRRAVWEQAKQPIKKHTQDAANSQFGGIPTRQSDSPFPSQWQNSFISEQDSRTSDLR